MRARVFHTPTNSSPAKLTRRQSTFYYSWFESEAHYSNNLQSVSTSFLTLLLCKLIVINKSSSIHWCYCGFPIIDPLPGPLSQESARRKEVKCISSTWPSLVPPVRMGDMEVYSLLVVHSEARLSGEPYSQEAHHRALRIPASLPFLVQDLQPFTRLQITF